MGLDWEINPDTGDIKYVGNGQTMMTVADFHRMLTDYWDANECIGNAPSTMITPQYIEINNPYYITDEVVKYITDG